MTITSGSGRGTRVFGVFPSPLPVPAGSRPSPSREPVPPRRRRGRVYVRAAGSVGRRLGRRGPQGSPARAGAPKPELRAQGHDARRGPDGRARTTTRHPLTCGGWAPGPRRHPRADEGRRRLDGDGEDLRGRAGSRAAEGAGQARGARGAPAPATAATSGAAWAAGEPAGPHEWDAAAAAAAAGRRAGPAQVTWPRCAAPSQPLGGSRCSRAADAAAHLLRCGTGAPTSLWLAATRALLF